MEDEAAQAQTEQTAAEPCLKYEQLEEGPSPEWDPQSYHSNQTEVELYRPEAEPYREEQEPCQ